MASSFQVFNGDVGELSDESFIFKEVTWKIRNIFTLFNIGNFRVKSPSFLFADATWCLRMLSNSQTVYDGKQYIDLTIERLESSVPKHNVFLKGYFKTRRNKEFESLGDNAQFDRQNYKWTIEMLLETSKLLNKQNLLAPNNTVTVCCEMRTPKRNTAIKTQTKQTGLVEAFSQTELVGSIEAFSQTELVGSVEVYTETDVGGSIEMIDDKLPLSAVVYSDKVVQDLSELLISEEGSDVIIQIKGQKFRAHRAILSARSSVFASMFRSDMKEKATGVVDVEDCEPSTFPDFLQFLYCGRVDNLSVENVFSLYTTADKYDVQDLKSLCVEFLKNNSSVDSFCDTIKLSLQHSETELLKLATNFFANNLQEIIMTVNWQTFLTENPIQSNELLIKAMACLNITKCSKNK